MPVLDRQRGSTMQEREFNRVMGTMRLLVWFLSAGSLCVGLLCGLYLGWSWWA